MARPLITMIGATGAGKTVQASILAKRRGWAHVSTGELLRIDNNPLMIKALNRGELAPPDYINSLLAKQLATLTQEDGVAVDGYPRMLEEARWLEKHIVETDFQLGGVIYLKISREESIARILHRGRSDDSRMSLEEKWDYFESEVTPVINYYREIGCLIEIDGQGSVQEVADRVERAVA